MKHWGIAVLTAVIYLAVSLLLDGWAWTWLIWLAYGVYRITDIIKHADD